MSAAGIILLQKVVTNIAQDRSYCNRWTSILSLERVFLAWYRFNNAMTITKVTISRAISKIDPKIDDMNTKHQAGIYCGVNRNEKYIISRTLLPIHLCSHPYGTMILHVKRLDMSIRKKLINTLVGSKMVDRSKGALRRDWSTRWIWLIVLNYYRKWATFVVSIKWGGAAKTFKCLLAKQLGTQPFHPKERRQCDGIFGPSSRVLGTTVDENDALARLVPYTDKITDLTNKQRTLLQNKLSYLKKKSWRLKISTRWRGKSVVASVV